MNLRKFNKNLKQEYQNSVSAPLRKNKRFQFKWRYLALAAAVFFMCFLVGEHITVMVYNSQINRQKEPVLNMEDTTLYQINNKEEYWKEVKFIRTKTEKKSILQTIFSLQLLSCGSDEKEALTPPIMNESNSDFETNVQTKGVDEADTAKCDGTYIYAILYNKLYIYNLNGDILYAESTTADRLYVYRQRLVLLGSRETGICFFDGETLTPEYTISYSRLTESRLKENKLYLITAERADADTLNYDSIYYDGCINPYWVYSIIQYDLETGEESKVQCLNAYTAVIYMSQQHIYIASNNYSSLTTAVFVSVFDLNLNPVGVIKTAGTVLNQFSMDEYNGYLRMVTTDYAQPDEELNALSVYDLTTLKLTGRISKGIGLGRQEVKSVRFDGATCYIVTYLTQDPLYEIDCTNVSAPIIISQYEAPGYSGYLHTFSIHGKTYVLGLGYTDSGNHKISVYENDEATAQIGTDLVIAEEVREGSYYLVKTGLNSEMFTNHRSLFIYNDDTYLYLGFMVAYNRYTVFKIDVSDTVQPVSVFEEFTLDTDFLNTRGFLVEGKFYIPHRYGLNIYIWN